MMKHLRSINEKKPKGAPDWHDSDAPDANGRFKDLSIKDLAKWLIKTRKSDVKRISGSLTQQIVFNRNDDPKYAEKMEKTRKEVYKQLGREDLLEAKPGPDAYMTGLSDDEVKAKKAKMKKQAEMEDDDPASYKELPGDKEAREEDKVKKSKHTVAYNKKFKKPMENLKSFDNYEHTNEASRRKVHKAAKQGSYPAVIVVVQDGKVIHQEPVSTPDVAPATFNVMQEKYPKATLHLEDNTGKRLFSESVVTEKMNLSEIKKIIKTKEYKEILQALDNVQEVSDIWNMLDPKMFKFTEDEFEDIFADWWNTQSYDSLEEFSTGGSTEDAITLYKHLLPYVTESVVTEAKDPYKEIEKAIKGMKGVSADIKGDTIIVSNKAGDEFTYSMNDADDIEEFIATIEESVVTEAKNTIGLAFKEEQDYLDFKEFVAEQPKGVIRKNIGFDSKTKSWNVEMDVKVLDSIYGEGHPGNKNSGWYGGLPDDFESVIIESVVTEAKSSKEKFKEESDAYQEMINNPEKRVYDIVDFAQFTTGGMTEKQWEMFMYGRYKKDLQSKDSKIKEKMYKVLTKWLGESIVNEGKRLSFKDAGITDTMDLSNAMDALRDSGIDWDQKGQSFVFVSSKDLASAIKALGIEESVVTEASDAHYIKQLTDTFNKFKLPKKYEIMMASIYGGGSKWAVLRKKKEYREGCIIDTLYIDGGSNYEGYIELKDARSARPIPGKNRFAADEIDDAMEAAVKHVNGIKESLLNFDEYESVNELRTNQVSGTKAGFTQSLEDRKYELKKDAKGATIGSFSNVTLPKGTIIYNLPGGVFADHFSLKNKYTSRSSQGPQYFDKPNFKGIMIKSTPAVLSYIEKNSKVLESVVTEAKAYKLKASEFGGDTHSAAYAVKGENGTWRVHSTYAIDQVSGENNPDERDVVFFEAFPMKDEIIIKIGGINNLKRTNGSTYGNNFGATLEEWKNDPEGIAKNASEFLTDATHLKWLNKRARSEGQVIKWALKDDYSSVIIDLVNKALGLAESVDEKREEVGKYNTVKKVIAEVGRRPSVRFLADFIMNNYYDVTEVEKGEDDETANDKIADLVGFFKYDTEEWEEAWEDREDANESMVIESKDTMIKQIKRAIKDGGSIFKLPMKTQEYYIKHKDDFLKKESVNEEKIKYIKGKGTTYQSSGHWTVQVDSNSSMCDISVNSQAGWRLDPHDDREETWQLLDGGRQRATIYFRSGNIDKFAKQMFDLNDKTTWGNKTTLTAKDYGDIIRVWIDMKKANEGIDVLCYEDFAIERGILLEAEQTTNDQSPLGDDGMETGIKNKAKESGVPVGLLRIIMKRGLAAWKTGHRPGATQAQWGYARVNSFLTKQPGTWGKADSDIAKKVRDGGHDKEL